MKKENNNLKELINSPTGKLSTNSSIKEDNEIKLLGNKTYIHDIISKFDEFNLKLKKIEIDTEKYDLLNDIRFDLIKLLNSDKAIDMNLPYSEVFKIIEKYINKVLSS